MILDRNTRNNHLTNELVNIRQEFNLQLQNQQSYIQGLQSNCLKLEDRILEANKEIMAIHSYFIQNMLIS